MKYLHPEDAERIEILKNKSDRELVPAELLIKRVINFDHTYEYSDDINVYHTWSAKEKELRQDLLESDLINAEVKALALKALKNTVSHEPLQQLVDRYPNIKYEHYGPTGFTKLLEEKGDEYTERAIETLRELGSLIDELPPALYPGWFIMTPATPHQKIMRDYARSDTGRDSWYGYALPKPLHDRIWNFFDKCMFQKEGWKTIVETYELARAKSAGVNYGLQYNVSDDAPAKYTGTPAAWLYVHGPGKVYRFYV